MFTITLNFVIIVLCVGDMMNNKIEQFLSFDSNDSLRNMSYADLKHLKYLLYNYYLGMRSQLNFGLENIFGIEIEYELSKLSNDELRIIIPDKAFTIDDEPTVYQGGEIQSPKLKNTPQTWCRIKEICKFINTYAQTGPNAGVHIHVGTQVLGGEASSWFNFMKLWATYENIIYRFAYGEYLNARETINEYAHPVASVFFAACEYLKNHKHLTENDIVPITGYPVTYGVDFSHVYNLNAESIYNTIEFRCFNTTFEPAILQNNINLVINMIRCCKNKDFNAGLVEKRMFYNQYKSTNLQEYEKIEYEKAIEFADIVFNNNEDKVNFLRQYLKNDQSDDVYKNKAKRFVK